MCSLCHPWFTTTNLSYRFPIFETSAAALCGTAGTNTKDCTQVYTYTLSIVTLILHVSFSLGRTSKERHCPWRRDPSSTCGRPHPIFSLPIWTWIRTRKACSRQMFPGNWCRQLQYTITQVIVASMWLDDLLDHVPWCRNYFIQCERVTSCQSQALNFWLRFVAPRTSRQNMWPHKDAHRVSPAFK